LSLLQRDSYLPDSRTIAMLIFLALHILGASIGVAGLTYNGSVCVGLLSERRNVCRLDKRLNMCCSSAASVSILGGLRLSSLPALYCVCCRTCTSTRFSRALSRHYARHCQRGKAVRRVTRPAAFGAHLLEALQAHEPRPGGFAMRRMISRKAARMASLSIGALFIEFRSAVPGMSHEHYTLRSAE
jgi:hypothetical protein